MLRALRKFITNHRGNVAMITALSIAPISVLVGASVDLSRMRVEHTRLQSAVDAAVLAAANMPNNTTNQAINSAVNNFVSANFSGQSTIYNTHIVRTDTGVEATTYADVPLTFAALLGQNTRRISAHAIAERGGTNIEVSLVLDVTGSMASSNRIRDLRNAASALIDIVVKDQQTPFYTKMAIVPWSNSVNLGTAARAASARGAVVGTVRNVSGSTAWAVSNTTKNITGATKARPVVITSNGHGYTNGQHIYISGVRGMTQLNDSVYVVTNRQNNTFELYDLDGNRVDGRNFSNFTTSGGTGTATRCNVTACQAQITVNSHGYQNGDRVYVTGVGGTLGGYINNQVWTVASRQPNTMVLSGSVAPANWSSGGQVYCTTAGCPYYAFTNTSNRLTALPLTNCVSERIGAQAYTQATPASAPVGRVYETAGSGCPDATLLPLTSNRTTLHAKISDLDTTGTTAGQIGIAWGWYTLSPNFNALWGAASERAGAYDPRETQKIAVIMTDGEFNTGYCNGVLSSDSISLGGDRINCSATNGNTFAQARSLCTSMKQAGIIIYTVGFAVGNDQNVVNTLRHCASESSYAHLASTGAELNAAFREIGNSIGRLRLTR